MKRKTSLVVGLICSCICMISLFAYAQTLKSSYEAQRNEAIARFGGEQVDIVVATKAIKKGDVVSDSNARLVSWVSELVPSGTCSSMQEVSGLTATSDIFQGEPINKARFNKVESDSISVPAGKCAVSVPAKNVSTVGGAIQAGSFVDVYSCTKASSDLLFEHLLVLSTNSNSSQDTADTGRSSKEIAWIVLAVEPQQVSILISSAKNSELYFALPGDTASITNNDSSHASRTHASTSESSHASDAA